MNIASNAFMLLLVAVWMLYFVAATGNMSHAGVLQRLKGGMNKMKQHIFDFLRRGLIACGFGPMILAFLYLILQHHGVIELLTVNEVCLGIFSLSLLAFVAGGLNILYQIDKLPLMLAILIHGSVLYVCYLVTYLLNAWIEWSLTPVLVFSAIFIFGYFVIWIIIYSIVKRNANIVNSKLKDKQKLIEEA